ncbi:MAG: hypothetical protein AAF939_12850 [Planctomycetota bacterium]
MIKFHRIFLVLVCIVSGAKFDDLARAQTLAKQKDPSQSQDQETEKKQTDTGSKKQSDAPAKKQGDKESKESFRSDNPKDALHRFFNGMFEAKYRKSIENTVLRPGIEGYVRATIAVNQAMNRLSAIDTKRYGGEKAIPPDLLSRATQMALEKVEIEQIDENTARWPLKPDNPMILVKQDGYWKVDFSDKKFDLFIELSTESFSAIAASLNSLSDRTEAGEFKTREALRLEFKKRLGQ